MKQIGGRGKLGDQNWGASCKFSSKEAQRVLNDVNQHIGKDVYLAGGGGSGIFKGVLQKAWIKTWRGGHRAVQVKLVSLNPPLAGMSNFTPILDSWQLFVED